MARQGVRRLAAVALTLLVPVAGFLGGGSSAFAPGRRAAATRRPRAPSASALRMMALDQFMSKQLDMIRLSFDELSARLADDDVLSDPKLLRTISSQVSSSRRRRRRRRSSPCVLLLLLLLVGLMSLFFVLFDRR